MTEKRKLFRPADGIVLGAVLLICAGALLWFQFGQKEERAAAPVAEISCNGELVRRINLDSAKDGVFGLEENDRVHFEISEGKIRFVEVDCPDKLCENAGYLDSANQIAVCLPNRVSLKIVSGQAQVDGIVN